MLSDIQLTVKECQIEFLIIDSLQSIWQWGGYRDGTINKAGIKYIGITFF